MFFFLYRVRAACPLTPFVTASALWLSRTAPVVFPCTLWASPLVYAFLPRMSIAETLSAQDRPRDEVLRGYFKRAHFNRLWRLGCEAEDERASVYFGHPLLRHHCLYPHRVQPGDGWTFDDTSVRVLVPMRLCQDRDAVDHGHNLDASTSSSLFAFTIIRDGIPENRSGFWRGDADVPHERQRRSASIRSWTPRLPPCFVLYMRRSYILYFRLLSSCCGHILMRWSRVISLQ